MLGGIGNTLIELRDSTGASVTDYITLTDRERGDVRVHHIPVLDCPDKELDNGDIKRFSRGFRVHIEIDFRADDWVTLTSDDGRTFQEFLVDLHNHTTVIRIQPHTDKSHTYDVLVENPFNYPHAFRRWAGWVGTLIFKGNEIIDTIPIAP